MKGPFLDPRVRRAYALPPTVPPGWRVAEAFPMWIYVSPAGTVTPLAPGMPYFHGAASDPANHGGRE